MADPIIKQDDTSSSVTIGADNAQSNTQDNTGQSPETQAAQAGQQGDQGQQTQSAQVQTSDPNKPNTAGQFVQNSLDQKNEYFKHEGQGYYRRDGKTYRFKMGGVLPDEELSSEEAAQIDQARADNAISSKPASGKDPGQSSETPSGHTLVAGNGDLCHFDANGNLVGMYSYMSGVDGVSDPSARDKGPIPLGEYALNTNNISEVGGLRYLARRLTGDWGHYRVPLAPTAETNTFGRDGFYIHGGDTPGSKGCIDVGKYDRYLFPALKEAGGTIRLTVK